jgi:cytochrome b561
MLPTSVVLIASGLACLMVSVSVIRSIVRHAGPAPTAWTKTESRSTATALMLVFLIVFGAGLVIKGILS